jgi:hypothetical protein
VWPEGLGKLITTIHLIGFRTHHLPANWVKGIPEKIRRIRSLKHFFLIQLRSSNNSVGEDMRIGQIFLSSGLFLKIIICSILCRLPSVVSSQ